MKEYLDNEGVCFGVDCIRSYSEIRKLTQASIQACDQLLQVVTCRVQAEGAHASALADISQMPLAYISGSLQDCMSQLQSDTRHKANQHQILANSLTEEIIQPITLLKDQMSKKELVLFGQYTSMNKELKQLEDSFKKNSVQYEKIYQTAMTNISTCRKHGISNEEYKQLTDLAANEPQVNKSLATTWNSLTNLTLTSTTTNLLATKEKGKDWLNWAVASASGTPTPPVATTPLVSTSTGAKVNANSASKSTPLDKKGLCVMTMKTLAKLEKCRIATRKAWLDFVIVSQRYAIKTQILLTKLQGMQESFILIIQDHLRKIIVVESSFLANQQYDIQMLFKVMEEIDVREDMRQYILKTASTPLDLYESESDEDEDEDDDDEGAESDVDRNRSESYDGDEHDVEIVIEEDQEGGGKPSLTVQKKKSGQIPSAFENKNEIWSDSSWTSDIFPSSHSAKLKHIKELPLPPSEDTMTFSYLKSIMIEKHLDELDKHSSSPSASLSSSSTVSQHQYVPVERVRALTRLSLVSRHIDKHNCLAGEGQAGSSLARLEIATSTQKKKITRVVHSSPQPPHDNSSSSSSSAFASPLAPVHPLTSSAGLLDSPLTPAETPMKHEDRRDHHEMHRHTEETEEEEEEEELMTYGTAEEALEKMIILQTRIRPQWTALIEEFSEGSSSGDGQDQAEGVSTSAQGKGGGVTTSPNPKLLSKTSRDRELQGGGGAQEESNSVSSESSASSSGSSHDLPNSNGSSNSDSNNAITSNNQSSEGLDQLLQDSGTGGMLSRSLKDAENQKDENVDSVKCREIMNSFGLLDAVSVDVDDDHWHENSNSRQGGTSQPLSLPHSSLNNFSPQSVTGQHHPPQADTDTVDSSHTSTNSNTNTPTHPAAMMPFLSTTKSDYSDTSSSDLYPLAQSTPTTQTAGSSTPMDDGGGGGGGASFSMSHFGSATPESLDFLST